MAVGGFSGQNQGVSDNAAKLTLSVLLRYAASIVSFSAVLYDVAPDRDCPQADSAARNRCRSFAVRAPRADRGASMKSRLAAAVMGVVIVATCVSCTTIKTRVWMNEGNKLYKAQRYDEAVEIYKKIVAVDPSNWTANYLIAMSYTALYHPGSEHEKDKEYVDEAVK